MQPMIPMLFRRSPMSRKPNRAANKVSPDMMIAASAGDITLPHNLACYHANPTDNKPE